MANEHTDPSERSPRYAELHTHSYYSFLDGASSPEALIDTAAGLQLAGIALTDYNGFPGAVRFAEAAVAHPQLLTVYGSELPLYEPLKNKSQRDSLHRGKPLPHEASPDDDTHLLILAEGSYGYHRLASSITEGNLTGTGKGAPRHELEALAAAGNGAFIALTGGRNGAVRRALEHASNRSDAEQAALDAVTLLASLFGPDRVFVELTDHGHPGGDVLVDRLAALAAHVGLPTVATGAARYATPEDAPLADSLAAIQARRSLDEIDPFLPATGVAHLRSASAMYRLFPGHHAAVHRTVTLARELAFPLQAVKPSLPRFPVPSGHTQMSWLRHLVHLGAAQRYPTAGQRVTDRLEEELRVIEQKEFPGYFLIVHDIVRFARERTILCQGRGSAANSAVCYVLGITAVDAIHYHLPFERFLNSMREEEPDIDVDFESGRREEVIQYVYERYGRRNAAQVANVISYRAKSAIRDAAKALGYSATEQQALTKGVERSHTFHAPIPPSAPIPSVALTASTGASSIPPSVHTLASRLLTLPRHLGIHPGGMVLTDRPVGEICPIELGRMPGRSVLQWDKDDCAAMGLVKFDLLGLGMLSALRTMFTLIEEHTGEHWSLETIPREEPGVYDMLCRADAIGVFQVESRAQLNTLPRLLPRSFYDLVIEIALIRPGPLQGGAVHPYLRRRAGVEPVTFAHPRLRPVLERTLGVPLFQEQLMQMAMTVGGCSAADADLLRRSMGSKRGSERISNLKQKLFDGMHHNGLSASDAELIYAQIEAFADFGFAESHSISFALLVYASAWCKLHYPAAFLTGILRSQPMGFYSPRTLVEDARRHGVQVLAADVQSPTIDASLEREVDRPSHGGLQACIMDAQPPVPPFSACNPDTSASHRRDSSFTVRLGLGGIRGVTTETARCIVRARENGPFRDMADLARRADLDQATLESLSTAGACAGLGLSRREALWETAPAAENRERFLSGAAVQVQPPLFSLLTEAEQAALDLWSTGILTGRHPLAILRQRLDDYRVLRSDVLRSRGGAGPVRVAGIVTHRQRPHTAGGVTFLTLEDEAGTSNVVVWATVWEQHRRIARTSPALIVTGALERTADGLVNVIARSFEALGAPNGVASRDFR